MKKRDKIAAGLLLFAGAAFIVLVGTMPTWEAFSANMNEINNLDSQVKMLETQLEATRTQIAAIQDNVPLPPGVEIRKFQGNNREEMIKDILDRLTRKAAEPGNKLIYLLPYQADKIEQPLTPEEIKLRDEGKLVVPASPYDTMGYEMAIRGTYGTIQDFLTAIDNQKELVEIISISLVNEAGVDRAGTKAPSFQKSQDGENFSDVILDPSKPIRLTAKLRLILERQ